MPDEAREYCPGCEPTVDPQTELVSVSWCGVHVPRTVGSADALVNHALDFQLGSFEVEGIPNAAFCRMIHGRRHDA